MGSCTRNTIPADCPLLVAVLSQNCDTGRDDAHGSLGLRGRGHSAPSGTLARSRGHSTPSGTGSRSPDARTVPDRRGTHPSAWNVPGQGSRRRPAAVTCGGNRRQWPATAAAVTCGGNRRQWPAAASSRDLRRQPAAVTGDGGSTRGRVNAAGLHQRCTSAPRPQARTATAEPLSPPSRPLPCSSPSWQWPSWWWWPSSWWSSSSWPSWRWSCGWCASWPGPWRACPPAVRRPSRR